MSKERTKPISARIAQLRTDYSQHYIARERVRNKTEGLISPVDVSLKIPIKSIEHHEYHLERIRDGITEIKQNRCSKKIKFSRRLKHRKNHR